MMYNLVRFALFGITIFLSACGSLSQLPNINPPIDIDGLSGIKTTPKLSQEEASAGLQEALVKGVGVGTNKLQQSGGFSQNSVYKILLPDEIQTLESKIRSNALLNAAIGKELDNTILAMNQGAEIAMAKAFPIFQNSIKSMSFSDAIQILTNGKGAATEYLKNTTTPLLTAAFTPEIKNALQTVSIYNYWNPIIATVNRNKKLLGLSSDINPNLENYVTQKAIDALFQEIEIQENAFRQNPIQRTSDLLKKVFDYADKHPNNSNP